MVLIILADLSINYIRESRSLKNELAILKETEIEKSKNTLKDLVAIPFGIMEFYDEK